MKHTNDPGPCPKCDELLTGVDTLLVTWFHLQRQADSQLHVSCGYRTRAEQEAAKARGASKAGFGSSPHSYLPAMAIDVFQIQDGKALYPVEWYKMLAESLPEYLQSGGYFPQGFTDWPHVQVRAWKTLVKNYPNGNE